MAEELALKRRKRFNEEQIIGILSEARRARRLRFAGDTASARSRSIAGRPNSVAWW
jgi:hypothetical protein